MSYQEGQFQYFISTWCFIIICFFGIVSNNRVYYFFIYHLTLPNVASLYCDKKVYKSAWFFNSVGELEFKPIYKLLRVKPCSVGFLWYYSDGIMLMNVSCVSERRSLVHGWIQDYGPSGRRIPRSKETGPILVYSKMRTLMTLRSLYCW